MNTYAISADFVIDLGMEHLQKCNDFYVITAYRRPIYMKYADEKTRDAYLCMDRTERRLDAVCDALYLSASDVLAAAKVASRWYKKTEWMLCLNCAERLIAAMCPRNIR